MRCGDFRHFDLFQVVEFCLDLRVANTRHGNKIGHGAFPLSKSAKAQKNAASAGGDRWNYCALWPAVCKAKELCCSTAKYARRKDAY